MRIRLLSLLLLVGLPLWAQVRFFVANDMGRNGYYSQRPVAELMGNMAVGARPECIVAAGDVHHFWGVESVSDPLWLTNFELVYAHPELMLPWYPLLGNHEYRGNTEACIDYSSVSRRWMMPGRFYTRCLAKGGVSVRLVMVDTTPLIGRYRTNPTKYPDASKQDVGQQMAWLDSVLTAAKEDWIVVVGHHPVFASTDKGGSERADMQATLLPVLAKHRVDMYVSGHIHNFQHLRMEGYGMDFVVNSSASLSRESTATEGTVFHSGVAGFSMVEATAAELVLRMIDEHGQVIHTVRRTK